MTGFCKGCSCNRSPKSIRTTTGCHQGAPPRAHVCLGTRESCHWADLTRTFCLVLLLGKPQPCTTKCNSSLKPERLTNLQTGTITPPTKMYPRVQMRLPCLQVAFSHFRAFLNSTEMHTQLMTMCPAQTPGHMGTSQDASTSRATWTTARLLH